MLLLSLMIVGCIGRIAGVPRNSGRDARSVADDAPKGESVNKKKAEQLGSSGQKRKGNTKKSPKDGTHTSAILSRKRLGVWDKGSVPDDDMVIRAAIAKAKSLGPVSKMKVCYRHEDDEWWIFLYHDIGTMIDVKQFVWSMESEKLRPFLVVKRVSKTKLEKKLQEEEPDSSCQILSLRTNSR